MCLGHVYAFDSVGGATYIYFRSLKVENFETLTPYSFRTGKTRTFVLGGLVKVLSLYVAPLDSALYLYSLRRKVGGKFWGAFV